jgi:hypothetical protein
MQTRSTTRKHEPQAGIALLISIFILLLISVVAIALIVASGTESAIAGNYRTATGVYYAALAGLEEARGRLLSRNPTSFKNTASALVATVPLPVGSPFYIINPVTGENVAPWAPGSNYPDTEFNPEFLSSGFTLPNPSPSTNSVSTVAGIQGPSFKWVRINAVSEMSLNLDVDNDGNKDKTTPIYYDTVNSKLNTTYTGYQVFEITSFAVLPNGSQKLLQYLVAPLPINLPGVPLASLPALTIAGSVAGVAFSAPTSNGSYYVSGVDLATVPFCTAGLPTVAIGVFASNDVTNVKSGGNGGTGIPTAMQPQYNGSAAAPDVFNVSVPFAGLQTPTQFDALAQSIAQGADVTIPSGPITYPLPTVTGSALTSLGMMSSNPMTVVINGNLDLTGWRYTGYGLLLVIGNLNYDPDASWQGMVMVIGQGTVTGSKTGNGEFDGAFIVAQTRDSLGTLLTDPNLGTASINFAPGMGGVGMRYSSCWVQRAMPTANYKILSFHEISQ